MNRGSTPDAGRPEEDGERPLEQSQKLDALGRLAGHVAHDFNNLLSVILSYSELVASELDADNPIRADVEEIQRAGRRAADLTRQMLAFSRQQVLAPRVLDLNEILSGVSRTLARVLGDETEFKIEPGTRLGNTRVDPAQIEQVLMNLVVNARDAMPRGGKVTIATSNVDLDEAYARTHPDVVPGPFVALTVTDTGTGMDRATIARVFEPFFTTKDRGSGSGLGLSAVFGIVKQSDGHIRVSSEPGVGTTFTLYLPRVDGPPGDEGRLS